jgi:hypothetical protein
MPTLTPTAVFIYGDNETGVFSTRMAGKDIHESTDYDLLKRRTQDRIKQQGLAPVFINVFRALELPCKGVCGT